MYGLYEEDLGKELSRKARNFPGVVYFVFVILKEQRYSEETIVNIARIFLDNTGSSVITHIGPTRDGRYLLEKIHEILLCDLEYNKSKDRCMKIQVGLSLVKKTQKARKKTQPAGSQPRKLSDVEMDWYVNYSGTDKVLWESRRGVYRKNGASKAFNKNVCWELPKSGTGYTTYNRNDLQKNYPMPNRKGFGDDYGYDQIGTKTTVEAMIRIARDWSGYLKNPNKRKLQIGDMSRPGGINTPDHGGHDSGNIIDMRPLRKDSQTGDAANLNYKTTGVYDQDLTKEFIRMLKKLYPNIFIRFNDGEIAGKGAFTYVHKDANNGKVHNDHLHLEFR